MSGHGFVLSAPRLRLRAPVRADAPRLAELAADYDILKMTARMPHPYGVDDALALVAAVEAEDPRREVTFLLEDGSGPVGVLGFFDSGLPGPEVGYWIGRPYWGRGYATEALETALRWSEQGWRRRVVFAGHFADNPVSGRVLEKTGFLYTGVAQPMFSRARGGEAVSRSMVRIA